MFNIDLVFFFFNFYLINWSEQTNNIILNYNSKIIIIKIKIKKIINKKLLKK